MRPPHLFLWLVLTALAACANEAEPGSRLLSHAPDDVRDSLERADRHILVVRHARKVSEDCNALDCPLSAHGAMMARRLAELTGLLPLEAALSSNACRTVETARAGGAPVIQHQAGPGHEARCGGGKPVTRTRGDAMEQARQSEAAWLLVAEHSNTVCAWLETFAPGAEPMCRTGALPAERYGDIFWLYRTDGVWRLARLDAAFEVPEANL